MKNENEIDIGNPVIVFGLAAQGHIPTIEKMLSDGSHWSEIGKTIGWDACTARDYYERYCCSKDDDDIAKKDVLPVLAAAIGMLEELGQSQSQFRRNDIRSIIYRANKVLASKTKGYCV